MSNRVAELFRSHLSQDQAETLTATINHRSVPSSSDELMTRFSALPEKVRRANPTFVHDHQRLRLVSSGTKRNEIVEKLRRELDRMEKKPARSNGHGNGKETDGKKES